MNAEHGEALRNGWIDAFRGVAALSVALFHFNVIPFEGSAGPVTAAWRAAWSHGHLGVPVFFALSGYCVTCSWLRSAGWRRYAWRRARRIFPPYWSSLAVIVALAVARRVFAGANDVAHVPSTPAAIAATLTMATQPFSHVATMNWVYWTLTCEVSFYAVLMLALLAPGARVLLLAGAHVALCLAGALRLAPVQGPLFFVNYWPLFGAGAALAVLASHRKAAVVMFAASAAAALLGNPDGPPGAAYAVAAFATTLLIWLARRGAMPRMVRPVRQLGVFSYSLYLMHVPLGVYGLMRLLPRGYPCDASYLASQLLVLAGTIALSWVFFRFAERPFIGPPSVP